MNICLYSGSYIRENGVRYCIKELCKLSLEIQGPFTHSLMHAHLSDNRKSLTSHCKHLVECDWVDILICYLIIPSTWPFNRNVYLWAREWYSDVNDHIFVFLCWMTMLYLGPNVSTLFWCMWCKSGNHMWGPTPPPLFFPPLVFYPKLSHIYP